MGGMSLLHWVIILVIVLVVFGPGKLPKVGQSLGEAIRGFKKGLDGSEIDVTNRKPENLNAGSGPAVNPAAQQTQNVADTTKPGGGTSGSGH